MKKTLTFPATETGKQLFQHLSDGVSIGSSDGKPKSEEETHRLAALQRMLAKISVPVPESDRDPIQRPFGARNLQGEGGEVVFEEHDILKMKKLVEATAWGGAQQIAISDLYNFLSTAPPVEEF